MPFSLYKRLDLEKIIPPDIPLQMADKSTTSPVGIWEDVHVQISHNCIILTDFVVLEMPEDDNMSIILWRPFLNTAGVVFYCNEGKVTSMLMTKSVVVVTTYAMGRLILGPDVCKGIQRRGGLRREAHEQGDLAPSILCIRFQPGSYKA
jgi:hypothetical protein